MIALASAQEGYRLTAPQRLALHIEEYRHRLVEALQKNKRPMTSEVLAHVLMRDPNDLQETDASLNSQILMRLLPYEKIEAKALKRQRH